MKETEFIKQLALILEVKPKDIVKKAVCKKILYYSN